MPYCLILHLNLQYYKLMLCWVTPSNPLDVALGADFSSFLAVSTTGSHFQSYESSIKFSHTPQRPRVPLQQLPIMIISLQQETESQPQAQSGVTAKRTSQSKQGPLLNMCEMPMCFHSIHKLKAISRKSQQRNAEGSTQSKEK